MTNNDSRMAELKSLERKANQQASIRSLHASLLNGIRTLIDVLGLGVGFLLAVLIFAEPTKLGIIGWTEEAQQIWIGILGLANFFAAILILYFRPAEAAKAQRRARRHYTRVRGLISEAVKRPEVSAAEFQGILDDYFDDEAFPDVPPRLFNYYKSRHLRTVEISKLLSKKPGMSLFQAHREVRRHLREQGEEAKN